MGFTGLGLGSRDSKLRSLIFCGELQLYGYTVLVCFLTVFSWQKLSAESLECQAFVKAFCNCIKPKRLQSSPVLAKLAGESPEVYGLFGLMVS